MPRCILAPVSLDDFPVQIRFPLHWGEMDALGHVNNTRFFAWFESARIATFQRIGVDASAPRRVGPILATTTCDFLIPVVYPGTIVVGCRVSKIGTTSMTFEYLVFRDDALDVPVARGSSVIVMIDYASGAKVPVPEEVRARVAALG